MKRTTLAVLIIAALSLTGLALTGCGLNRAQDQPEIGSVEEPQVEPAAPEAPVDTIDVREVELAARERAAERREDELDRRLRELEDRIEVAERPAAPQPPAIEPAVQTYPRRLETEAQPVTRTVELTLPAATALEVELRDALSSETSLPGDPVDAFVVRDVMQDGRIAVPAGSRLVGTVEEANAQKKIGGQTRLGVSFDRLLLPTGEDIEVLAYFAAEGKKQKTKDAATIGGAAAGGAVLGRVLSKSDKTKGTLIGAVLGGAIGTAIATQNNGDPVVLDAGTVLELFLETPVRIAVTETAPAAEPTVIATYR